MKTMQLLLNLFLALAGAMSMQADVLELKNGRVLNGNYVGGTAATIRFETANGIEVIETSQALALTFTGGGAAPAAAPAPASAPVPAPAPVTPKQVTLPAETSLLVRMKGSVSSGNQAGTPFATRLEYDLFADGVKVVPAGSVIYGEVKSSTQARRAFGQSTLDIRLTKISLANGVVPIVSSPYQAAGERAIKDAARGAAAGVLIGAVADGSSGAKTGAAIGATAGALRRGESIVIPPNTLLQFSLTEPVAIAVGG